MTAFTGTKSGVVGRGMARGMARGRPLDRVTLQGAVTSIALASPKLHLQK